MREDPGSAAWSCVSSARDSLEHTSEAFPMDRRALTKERHEGSHALGTRRDLDLDRARAALDRRPRRRRPKTSGTNASLRIAAIIRKVL